MSERGPAPIAFVRPRGGFWFGASIVLEHLADAGVESRVFEDGDPAALETGLWLMLRGSAGWHPRTMRLIASLPPAERPRALLWLTEPLPPPAVSGLAPSRRSRRDLAKLALRDPRANDQRTAADQRLGLGAAYRAAVVSEPMVRPDPYVAGLHSAVASASRLVSLMAAFDAAGGAGSESR